jgi:ABC-type dipeptide/oligopeptide/nickel transport system permease component
MFLIAFPFLVLMMIKGCRGRDRMVVGFSTICASVPITTIVMSLILIHGIKISLMACLGNPNLTTTAMVKI